jgi:hypothetical protein
MPVGASWHYLSEWEKGVLSHQTPGPSLLTLAARISEILVEEVFQMLVGLMYLTLLEASPGRSAEQDHLPTRIPQTKEVFGSELEATQKAVPATMLEIECHLERRPLVSRSHLAQTSEHWLDLRLEGTYQGTGR